MKRKITKPIPSSETLDIDEIMKIEQEPIITTIIQPIRWATCPNCGRETSQRLKLTYARSCEHCHFRFTPSREK